MIAAAFAVSLALAGTQSTPSTHEQAVTCAGVFFLISFDLTQKIKQDPSALNRERREIAGRLFAAADADRLAAARREGLTIDRSGGIFDALVEANFADAEPIVNRELVSCIARYRDPT